MQYADVALPVKTKTHQDAFTYMIPPALLPDVQIGCRVLVPFAGRKLIGVITGLRSQAPATKKGLQQILKYTDPIPLFPPVLLQLAQQVATEHGASLGQVLAAATPAPAPRTAQRLSLNKVNQQNTTKPSQLYALYQPIVKRWQGYRTAIERVYAQKKQSLILFPDNEHAEAFARYISARDIEVILLPAAIDKSQYYQLWLESMTGQHLVVVGTRKAVFLPLVRPGLIIVDSPSEYGYKEEQYPYYHAARVAEQRSQLEHSHLLLGDVAPTVTDWYRLQQHELKELSKTAGSTATTIIDTSTYRKLFPEVLLEKIKTVIEKSGRVAIYYNRKGEGRYYRCLECETAIYCQNCDSLLTVYAEEDKIVLRCNQCGYSTTPPYRCQICNSYKMGSVGLGVNSIAKILAQHFPDAMIGILSKDNPTYQPDNQITITTSQLLYQSPGVHFDLLATIHIDQILHGIHWRTNEEAYLTLCRLAERADQFVIQTSQPGHPVLQAYCANTIEVLYNTELAQRKQHNYPPFGAVTQLIFAGPDEEKVKKEVDRLYSELTVALPHLKVLEPAPIAVGKRRGRYRYQVIVRASLTKELANMIPPGWQIDPSPNVF